MNKDRLFFFSLIFMIHVNYLQVFPFFMRWHARNFAMCLFHLNQKNLRMPAIKSQRNKLKSCRISNYGRLYILKKKFALHIDRHLIILIFFFRLL